MRRPIKPRGTSQDPFQKETMVGSMGLLGVVEGCTIDQVEWAVEVDHEMDRRAWVG